MTDLSQICALMAVVVMAPHLTRVEARNLAKFFIAVSIFAGFLGAAS